MPGFVVLAIEIPFDPRIITLGGVMLTWHGLFTAAGILAAHYLSRLDRSTGIDYLMLVFKKEGPLREPAAQALAKSGNVRAVGPLSDWLGPKDQSSRLLAARTLAKLGGPKAISALRKAADDRDPALRKAVREALSLLGDYQD